MAHTFCIQLFRLVISESFSKCSISFGSFPIVQTKVALPFTLQLKFPIFFLSLCPETVLFLQDSAFSNLSGDKGALKTPLVFFKMVFFSISTATLCGEYCYLFLSRKHAIHLKSCSNWDNILLDCSIACWISYKH